MNGNGNSLGLLWSEECNSQGSSDIKLGSCPDIRRYKSQRSTVKCLDGWKWDCLMLLNVSRMLFSDIILESFVPESYNTCKMTPLLGDFKHQEEESPATTVRYNAGLYASQLVRSPHGRQRRNRSTFQSSVQ
ncbi:hypothetical protein TNCV_2365551 [Trichonephila clavipes]|nr:hypothetical protein TNCV_2365551 [Trichonephila clavipes]